MCVCAQVAHTQRTAKPPPTAHHPHERADAPNPRLVPAGSVALGAEGQVAAEVLREAQGPAVQPRNRERARVVFYCVVFLGRFETEKTSFLFWILFGGCFETKKNPAATSFWWFAFEAKEVSGARSWCSGNVGMNPGVP